jgi:O-antigen ligase
MEPLLSYLRQYQPRLIQAAKVLLVLMFCVPLLVGNSYFFPFIVPKYLLFRTLVELLALVYLLLLVADPHLYRPRLTLATWGLLAYVGSAVLSGLVGSDWHASFFGTFERMEGIFTTLHYAALFLVLPCLFSRRDWVPLLRWSVAIGTGVALYGLAQRFGVGWTVEAGRDRISSTIGNPAYVAAYLLFQMGFAAFLAAADWSLKRRWVWLAALAIQLVAFTLTLTRGAMLGLVASLPVAAFAWLWLTRPMGHRPAVRRWVMGLAAVAVLVPALLVTFQKSDLVRGTPLLQRFADISFSASTAKTRFYTWGSAWQGIKEKPILGWGPELFAIPFNKFINPLHYTGPNSETWFDHAHNIVLDVLVSQGAIGLLGWLAFVVGLLAAAWRLARSHQHRTLGLASLTILVAYLVQNMFLFDVLVVWMMLAVLGAMLLSRDEMPFDFRQPSSRTRWALLAGLVAYVAVLAAAAVPLNWRTNYLSRAIIVAKSNDSQPEGVAAQIDFFEHNIFGKPIGTGDAEAARQLAGSMLYHAQVGHLGKDAALREHVLKFTVDTLAATWHRHPNDLQTGLAYAKLRAVQGEATKDTKGYAEQLMDIVKE